MEEEPVPVIRYRELEDFSHIFLPEPQHLYPTDRLLSITPERAAYQSRSMELEIPRLDFKGPVIGGVTDYDLTLGVGLYDNAPLPQAPEFNGNISIAGHRDIYGCEFYYIDTLTENDELYLTYQNKRYIYRYDNTTIIESNDWSVIYCTEYPTITLTSCDPIGTSLNRIVVKGVLTGIEDVTPA